MLALLAFVELELTLSAIAIGVSLRARSRAHTLGATALGATATAAGLVLVWLIWFVAPWCLADTTNLVACTARQAGSSALLYALAIALVEWMWMVGLALFARFVAGRNLAHISV